MIIRYTHSPLHKVLSQTLVDRPSKPLGRRTFRSDSNRETQKSKLVPRFQRSIAPVMVGTRANGVKASRHVKIPFRREPPLYTRLLSELLFVNLSCDPVVVGAIRPSDVGQDCSWPFASGHGFVAITDPGRGYNHSDGLSSLWNPLRRCWLLRSSISLFTEIEFEAPVNFDLKVLVFISENNGLSPGRQAAIRYMPGSTMDQATRLTDCPM